MRKDIRDIYFQGEDDRNLEEFTKRFLSCGLFWVYIAVNQKKDWRNIYKKISNDKKPLFREEYNKAFLFVTSYKELTKLFLGRIIKLKNLFLPEEAENYPEKFIKYNRADDLRWKEILEFYGH